MKKHHNYFQDFLFIVLSLAFTISLASSAALNVSSRNLKLATSNGDQCSDNITWFGSGMTSIDCISAIQLLYNREVAHWKDEEFEFISGKVPGRSIPWQRTPRKYAVGISLLTLTLYITFISDLLFRNVHSRHCHVELLCKWRATWPR